MKNQILKSICLIVAILLVHVQQGHASGTVVGNGGDPVFEFLRATRESMNATMKFVLNQPEEKEKFCQSNRLSVEQVQFCRDFFFKVGHQILTLSSGDKPTDFVLREEPLYVQGPDGKAMSVAARTSLGPEGAIEFHRDSMRTMAPVQVLFLITHEFEHKVLFEGRAVTDNEKIGPFKSGRDLLDAVATSLVSVAKRKGKIGSQFGIRDLFACDASNGTGQFGAQIAGSRLFQDENLMTYETSVGGNPMEGSIYFQEDYNSVLRLKFVITEPNNCGEETNGRKTVVQILRSKATDKGRDETVVSTVIFADNPICKSNLRMIVRYGEIQFSCQYFASEGTTSSPFSTILGKK
ncbi:hypothetical protein [Bdellovibrio sp. KM01]|uniref:hypothetical protein n=1 Tax=Bdellovibrio sp. KM01 TaxID=2748865 RepID=UPI0015E9A248|nr:hypothetical protein [Bdellovibrio sp. KM01]QLY25164.1 hypothetical protein HW988_17365 [Bdellovibrio sp. KM01]